MTNTKVELKPMAPQGGVSRLFGIKIIKTRFQFKYSIIVFIFLAISAGCVWFWGNMTINQMIESGMIRGDDAVEAVKVLRDNIAYISILSLAIVFGLTLFLSHYIAGPIYRFEKTLEAMRDEGNLTLHVKLRKHDEFKETADLFNQALASLRSKLKKERDGVTTHVDKIQAYSETLK